MNADTRKTLTESLAAFRAAWKSDSEAVDVLVYAESLADDVERELEID